MNNKMKTSSRLEIIGLVLLTFGITGVNHHANDSSDVMEAESVEMVDEEEQQRLMNDKKVEADRQAEIKLAEDARLEEERLAEEARLEEERLAEEASLEEERLAEEARLEEERLAEEASLEEERLAEEARLEEERLAEEASLEEERLAEEKRVAEENRIKEAERVAQAEREAQAQTTSSQSSQGSSQTSTQPAPQPVIGSNKIGINGVYKSYTNYGAADTDTVQRGIDTGLIVAALTHFNPGDGQTTYFGGHNPGVINFMAANMYHGAIVTVTDSNGNPHRYKMVDHVNADVDGDTVFQSIGHSAVDVYAYGSNQESILIQFCNASNPLMSLWYGVPVN